jgi:hypothetical protein
MKKLLLILLAASTAPAYALTPLSGGITSNTTLTAANSPYQLTGDLVVFESVKLTIEPGVEILVDKDVKIEVRGQISAIGTASQPIYVHGNTQTHGKNFWKGFVFIATTNPLGTGSQADFNHCNVSDASYVFDMNLAYHGPYRFRNSIYSYNVSANYDGGIGGVLFDSCIFFNNVYGVSSFEYGGIVSNSLFDGNVDGSHGADVVQNCRFIHNTGVAIRPAGRTTGCEVYNNNVGVEGPFNNVNNLFVSNKIKNNSVGVRITNFFNGDVNFSGNEICSNVNNNIELSTTNNADLSHNCWCLSDSASIRNKVLDGYKDISRGLVSFGPFNTGCSDLQTTATPGIQLLAPEVIVSPNPVPANSSIKIAWQGIQEKDLRIQLRNTFGQFISFEKSGAGDGAIMIKTNAPAGIYYVLVTNAANGATTTSKIVLLD